MPKALAAFVATMPLVVLPGNDSPSALPQSMFLRVGVAFLWVCYLASPWLVRAKAWRPFLTPVLGLLIWSALSVAWATDVYMSLRLLERWMAAAGLALLISSTVQTLAQARLLLGAVFLSSVVVSVVGLLQHLWSFDLVPQAFPPAGTLGNKNLAAELVVAGLVPGFMFFFSSLRAAQLAGLAVAIAVTLAFVIHSGCRAAWMALTVQGLGAALLLYWGDVRVRWTTGRVVAMVLGVVCLWTLVVQPSRAPEPLGPARLVAGAARPIARLLSGVVEPSLDPSITPQGDLLAERSTVIRLGVWRNTRAMIATSPLSGIGAGNFSIEYPRFSRGGAAEGLGIEQRVESAHNDYLQLLAEIGLLGCLFATWAVAVLVRTVVSIARAGHPELNSLVLFSGLGLVGLMASAAVSPIVNQPSALSAGATFVGVVLSCARMCAPGQPEALETSQGRGRIRGLALAAAAATLVIFSASGLAELRADRHVLRMAQAELRQDWGEVIREGLLARHFNPGRMDFRFPTASALLRTGEAERASGLLREILAADPHNANALGNLAIAHMTLGDFASAKTRLKQLLSLRPDDAIAPGLLLTIESSERSSSPEGVHNQ